MLSPYQEQILSMVALADTHAWYKSAGGGIRAIIDGSRCCPLCAVEREIDPKSHGFMAPKSFRLGISESMINEFIMVADNECSELPKELHKYRQALLYTLGLRRDG